MSIEELITEALSWYRDSRQASANTTRAMNDEESEEASEAHQAAAERAGEELERLLEGRIQIVEQDETTEGAATSETRTAGQDEQSLVERSFEEWLRETFGPTLGPVSETEGLLQASVQVKGMTFHVEGHPIEQKEEGPPKTGAGVGGRSFDDFVRAAQPDGSFQTIRFGDREYAVFLYPHSA